MQNILLSFAFVSAVQLAANGQAYSPLCTQIGARCSTCSTVEYCTAINAVPYSTECRSPAPYCYGGACSATQSPECNTETAPIYQPNPPPMFTCPEEDGTYPDPLNCKIFYFCYNGQSTSYECTLKDGVYSPRTKSCVYNETSNPCYTVYCPSNIEMYVGHPGDSSIYFFCSNSIPTTVQRCPKDKVFNETQQSCVTACEYQGRVVDPDGDGNTWIECQWVWWGWNTGHFETVRRTCPEGLVFDPEIMECTSEIISEPSSPPERFPAPSNSSFPPIPPVTNTTYPPIATTKPTPGTWRPVPTRKPSTFRPPTWRPTRPKFSTRRPTRKPTRLWWTTPRRGGG